MSSGLAELLAYWADVDETWGRRELMILVMETIRDDLAQAQTKKGRPVVDIRDMQEYLTAQIQELRRLWEQSAEDAAD